MKDVLRKAFDDYFDYEGFERSDFSNPKMVGLAYTDSLDRSGETHNMEWFADVEDLTVYLVVDGLVKPGDIAWTIRFKSEEDMADEINRNEYGNWVAMADSYAEERL